VIKAGVLVKITGENGQMFYKRNFFAMSVFSSNITKAIHFPQK